ncbi:MAG TPA: M48 family metallopeptidase [Bacteroidia bacterium]|jgi:predicted Zn-dependent protease|nr:M48 family metallopeptidase [Bacteroidia bacterium]
MTNTSAGIFYDGLSSTPFQAVLAVGETDPCLHISVEKDGQATSFDWKLDSVHLEFSGSGRLLLSYSQDVPAKQLLEISDPAAIREMLQLLNKSGRVRWYNRLTRLGWKTYLIASLTTIAVLTAVYVFLLPGLAERAVLVIPVSVDYSIGEKAYEQFVSPEDIDSAKTARLQQFASAVDFGQERREIIPVVLNKKLVNAFALPDGHIIVYSGILDVIKTPEELAALLGHEYTHVAKRHMMKLLCRNIGGYILVSLALNDANSIMAVLADNAHNISGLSFSRHFEEEADQGAFDVLKANALPSDGMLHLLEALKKETKFNIPEFLSTHPLTTDRISFIQKKIKENPYVVSQKPMLQAYFDSLKGK